MVSQRVDIAHAFSCAKALCKIYYLLDFYYGAMICLFARDSDKPVRFPVK